jgi:hypothetical protein
VPNETAKAALQLERNRYLVHKHVNGWSDSMEQEEAVEEDIYSLN